MFQNSKRVFWEALILAVIVFSLGLLFGVAFEASKLEEVSEYYTLSEISLMDIVALNNVIESMPLNEENCNLLKDSNINFADRIYLEALLLEKYEDAGKVSQGIRLAHKKYDLLRTFLWISAAKTLEKCENINNFSLVVYLYDYEPEDLTKKATQSVWSKILFDLKQVKSSDVLLIPIAVDSNLTSLNSLVGKFDISEYPVVIIDNKHVVSELIGVEDIERYMD